MSNTKSNHFDVVGSLLRPAELKAARTEFEKGNISAEELREVEDRLIAEVIKKQKAHGLHYITDGEFRRSYWHLDFMWGFTEWSILNWNTAINSTARKQPRVLSV